MGFLKFIWYTFKNLLKVFILVFAFAFISELNMKSAEDISGNIGLFVFLFIILCVNVTTVFNLGGGWFLEVTSGASLGAGFAGLVIALIISMTTMQWVANHTSIAMGITLSIFALSHIVETVKYADALPKFFTVTGALCALDYVIEAICLFLNKPPFLFNVDGDLEGFASLFMFLGMMFVCIFTVVNIIARGTQAHWVED